MQAPEKRENWEEAAGREPKHCEEQNTGLKLFFKMAEAHLLIPALLFHVGSVLVSLFFRESLLSISLFFVFLTTAAVLFFFTPLRNFLICLFDFSLFLGGRALLFRQSLYWLPILFAACVCLFAMLIMDIEHLRYCRLSHELAALREERETLLLENEELRHFSLTDDLTGMYNRRYYQERITSLDFSSHSNYAFFMMDIDYFKSYNDAYGHLLGDECLERFSKILLDFLELREGFAIRCGGEEFLLCLFDIPGETALFAAEDLRSAVERTCTKNTGLLSCGEITVSIGVAQGAYWTPDLAQRLLRESDLALYKAKKGGRNRVEVYHDESYPLPACVNN